MLMVINGHCTFVISLLAFCEIVNFKGGYSPENQFGLIWKLRLTAFCFSRPGFSWGLPYHSRVPLCQDQFHLALPLEPTAGNVPLFIWIS